MTNETMIELCNTVSSLAVERDMWRQQANAWSDDGGNVTSMRQALDRRGEAIEALELERDDLRAKLALQQQIATGATAQRDEQTARLAEAQAEIAALRAERDELKASKPTSVEVMVPIRAVLGRLEYHARLREIDCATEAARVIRSVASAIDLAFGEGRTAGEPQTGETAGEVVRSSVHSGRVITNELTKEEVAFARGDGVLLVSDDGIGSVPRDWFERACRARPKAGEVTT